MRILSIILGILMVLAGGWCIVNPVTTAVTIGWLLGIFLLIGGGSVLFLAIKYTKSVLDIIFGILTMIVGIMSLCSFFGALAALDALVMVMSVSVLVSGITRIVLSFQLKKLEPNWWIVLVSGILSVIAGGLLLCNPLSGMLLVETMFSVAVIMEGINLVVFGIAAPHNN